MSDLQNQYTQDGAQQMWGLVTGSMAGLIDGLLILVAYILYPFVVAIFGFFYIFYGSILYIFGPIVIALMPLGATNRIAKAYAENVFIWNAWPILYGGFGALLSAVQMGQVGQMLNQSNFLGGLGNLEGSFLIGAASIIYSLAIAIIPFIAKRIVSGDVGSTAAAMIGTAVTALTVGAAAVEGAAAGLAAGGAGAGAGTSAGSSSAGGATSAGSARPSATSAGTNQPTPPQQSPRALTSGGNEPMSGLSSYASEPTAEGHAEQIRSFFSDAMGGDESSGADADVMSGSGGTPSAAAESSIPISGRSGGGTRSSAMVKRGPSVHRYNLGTWGAYHAARLTTRTLAGSGNGRSEQ